MFFRFDPQMRPRLEAWVGQVSCQLELFKGMKESIKRLHLNGTHAEFLNFLQKPISNLMAASVALSDAVSHEILSDLRICRCVGRHQAQ